MTAGKIPRAARPRLAGAVALACLAMCAPAWAADITRELAPGAQSEHCLALAPGQVLDYRFTASRPLQFNVHYHVGREIVFPVPESELDAHAGKVTVDRPRNCCLMWVNRSQAPVHIDFDARVAPVPGTAR